MPGRMRSQVCSMASAASSLASFMRSISCAVLMARALRQQGRCVHDFARDRLEGVEPRLRPGASARPPCDRRSAFPAKAPVRSCPVRSRSFRTCTATSRERKVGGRGSRSVVALEQPNVLRPGGAARVVFLRLDGDERGFAFAREDRDVVALHAPVVGEVDDVVGRADDQRVEIMLLHQIADAVQFRFVDRIGHVQWIVFWIVIVVQLGSSSCHPEQRSAPV